jgi:hypothetical protein
LRIWDLGFKEFHTPRNLSLQTATFYLTPYTLHLIPRVVFQAECDNYEKPYPFINYDIAYYLLCSR